MLQLFEFVWTLRSSIRVGFNNLKVRLVAIFSNTLFNDNNPNNVQPISETFKKIFNYVRVEIFSNNATGCRLYLSNQIIKIIKRENVRIN